MRSHDTPTHTSIRLHSPVESTHLASRPIKPESILPLPSHTLRQSLPQPWRNSQCAHSSTHARPWNPTPTSLTAARGRLPLPLPPCFPSNTTRHQLEVMHHLRFRYMTTPRAEGRRNELRQVMLGEVQRGYLRNLGAHEIRVQATLHGSVAHHDQAPLLETVGARGRVEKGTTYE